MYNVLSTKYRLIANVLCRSTEFRAKNTTYSVLIKIRTRLYRVFNNIRLLVATFYVSLIRLFYVLV